MKNKCPVCGIADCCKFVFVEHIEENGLINTANPSDLHFVFMCANLHFFDSGGERIEQVGVEKRLTSPHK